MKRIDFLFFTFLFLLLSFYLSSCSSATINNDYSHSFDFAKITSYKIIKRTPLGPTGYSMPSATFGFILSAIKKEMAERKITRDPNSAELGITWQTAFNDELYDNSGLLKNWQDYISKTDIGLLIIDIVDLSTNNVIWRGWQKDVLNSESLEKSIDTAVTEILSSFPPK